MKQNKTERLPTGVSEIRKIKVSSRGRTPDGEPNPIDTHVGQSDSPCAASFWDTVRKNWPPYWGLLFSRCKNMKRA